MGLNVKSSAVPHDKFMQSDFQDQLVKNRKLCTAMADSFGAQYYTSGSPKSNGGGSSLPMHHAWTGNNGCDIWHHKSSRLFSARNGLLMCSAIRDNFDKDVIAIVLVLPEQPPLEALVSWVRNPVREYKVCVLDMNWECIGDPISVGLDLEAIGWPTIGVQKRTSPSCLLFVFSLLYSTFAVGLESGLWSEEYLWAL